MQISVLGSGKKRFIHAQTICLEHNNKPWNVMISSNIYLAPMNCLKGLAVVTIDILLQEDSKQIAMYLKQEWQQKEIKI
jgi:hypothetical protein